jgi:hypothetical protein
LAALATAILNALQRSQIRSDIILDIAEQFASTFGLPFVKAAVNYLGDGGALGEGIFHVRI